MNREELKRAVAEKARTAATVPNGKSAYAELIMETVEPNHLSLELFNAFLPTTQMNPGDIVQRKVRRGRYPVRTMVPGVKHMTDQTDYQVQQAFMFDRLITGTQRSIWEIQSGEVGTVDSMRTDLRADLFDEIVSRVFTLLATTWNSTATPNNYADSTGGVTSTVLDAMIENLLLVNPGVKSIVGTRAALLPIYRFAQYKEFALTGTVTNVAFQTDAFQEFRNTNKVSTYLGIPLIELPNVYRNRLPNIRERMIPGDRILVIADDVGQAALMGPTEYQDYTDPTTQPPNYVLHCWQQFGVIVDNVEGIGVIKV